MAQMNRFVPSSPGHTVRVTKKNAIAANTPDTISPRYSAFMILPPGFTLTKNVPTIDAGIDTAPSTSGYSTPVLP